MKYEHPKSSENVFNFAWSSPLAAMSKPTGIEDAIEAFYNLGIRSYTLLISGMCVILSFHLCTQLMARHLNHWTKPNEQFPIIFIIAMVPLFAVDSYIGLVEMPNWEVLVTILDSIKECYEAFVIHNFLKLMFSFMKVSPKPGSAIPDSIKGRVLHHSFPVTLFLPKEVIISRDTLHTLSLFTKQFVIIRPFFSLLLCLLELFELDKPPFTWIITAIFNLSIFLAMYALLMFYHGFEKELAPHKPLAKFLCIKGVVFFAFWQGIIVKLLVVFGVLHEGHFPYTVRQLGEAIQYFLICLEMLLFSFAFMHAFSAAEYDSTYSSLHREKEKVEAIRASYGLPPEKTSLKEEDQSEERKKEK